LQENIVKAENLPKHVIHALIDVEDKNFYNHYGVDVLAIVRSTLYNIVSNKIVTGGSTITQQLAKNILQNEEKVSVYDKTLMRKIKELLLALQLGRKYTKTQILTFYFNRIYFGSACYGIYSGAVTHFNKLPSQLNIYEAAALVGLIQAPSRFAGNQDSWKKRTRRVLRAMYKHKHITKQQLDDFETFNFEPRRNMANYGYFCDWVVTKIPPHLKNRDLVVRTTIDPTVQEHAMNALHKAHEEFGQQWNAEQGAMIVLDKNGAVRALVGGLNYQESQFNRTVSAQRSVGSFFKFYIYLEAIRRGLNPESAIEDKQLSFGAWTPSNYLHKSQGKIKIKDAYAQSVNSSAIMLLLACGLKKTIELVKSLGINQEIKENPSIALGGFNSSLLELSTTILPIINHGYKTSAYCIDEIRDAATDEVLYKHSTKFEKVLDARTVWYMWKLMQHAKTGTARRLAKLPNKLIVGGKTGTSNDYRDLTFVGATPDYVFGVWYGRDDYQPMTYVPGSNLAVLASYYFLEAMPDTQQDLDVEPGFQYNALTFEDLLLQ